MFALVVLFVILTDNKAFNVFFGCGLILGSIVRLFYSDRNYLTSFQIDEHNLNINYLTPLLKVKSRQYIIADISNIEINKANWLIDYPTALHFKHQEDWVKFEITDKKLKTEVQQISTALHQTV
jgi:hypothetical protein